MYYYLQDRAMVGNVADIRDIFSGIKSQASTAQWRGAALSADTVMMRWTGWWSEGVE
jgi:hypothetical protein